MDTSLSKLFVPKQPLKWDRATEYELIERRLPNGTTIYVNFTESRDHDFSCATRCFVGSHEEKHAHFGEHMVGYPKGVGNLYEKIVNTALDFSGYTDSSFTHYDATIFHEYLAQLLTVNPHALEHLITLNYLTTFDTEVTDEIVAIEKSRIATELAGRKDGPQYRFYDYILPLISIGKDFCEPTLDEVLQCTTAQVNKLLINRRHHIREVSIEGFVPDTAATPTSLADSACDLLAQLPKAQPVTLDACHQSIAPYGTTLSIKPAYDTFDQYIGIMQSVQFAPDPKEHHAQRAFTSLLAKVFYNVTLSKQLSYGSFGSGLEFDHDRLQTTFDAITTSELAKSYKEIELLLADIFSDSPSAFIRTLFEERKVEETIAFFFKPTLLRLKYCHKLGISSADNGAALYPLITNITLEEVLEAGKKLHSQGRIGIVHYGTSTKELSKAFAHVMEKDLMSSWQT